MNEELNKYRTEIRQIMKILRIKPELLEIENITEEIVATKNIREIYKVLHGDFCSLFAAKDAVEMAREIKEMM